MLGIKEKIVNIEFIFLIFTKIIGKIITAQINGCFDVHAIIAEVTENYNFFKRKGLGRKECSL